MCRDAISQFDGAVERVTRDCSTEHLQEASNCARVAWANVYDVLLIAGGFERRELDRFVASIDRCIRSLAGDAERARDEQVSSLLRQLRWYQHLLQLYRHEGLAEVDRAIEDAYEQLGQSA